MTIATISLKISKIAFGNSIKLSGFPARRLASH